MWAALAARSPSCRDSGEQFRSGGKGLEEKAFGLKFRSWFGLNAGRTKRSSAEALRAFHARFRTTHLHHDGS